MRAHATTSWRAAAAATIACLGLLAGCGGGNDGPASKHPELQGGSVEDELGFTRKGTNAAQARVENAIAACMKAEGFEYVPVDPVVAQTALAGKPINSDEDFEKQFGYGISTLHGRGSTDSDPNAKIRRRLDRGELRAYDDALSGGRLELTFARAVDEGRFDELGGCTKRATDELLGGTEQLATLQRKLDELDESIEGHPRMIRAGEAWATCMRAATGEAYESSGDIEDEIRKRFEAIVGSVPPLAAGQIAPEGSYDRAALTALQRREVQLASQDIACERRHIAPVEDALRADKEAVFRDENADLLSKVKPLGS